MRRRDFVTLLGGAATVWPLPSRSQQSSGKIPVVGVLWHAGSAEEEDVYLRPLRKAFIDLGYTEGENIHFEHRFPAENPERFQTMARELVDLKPDAIIAVTTPPMQAPASFNLDAVKAQVEDAIKAHQGD